MRGAEVIERIGLGPVTSAPAAAPTPTARPKQPVEARKPAPQPVVYRPPVSARHQAKEDEMRPRLEWLEKHTGRYDLEAVILGMQRELHGLSIRELYSETILGGQGRGDEVLGVR